ncbi:hypothetical protein BB559_004319 [Furculomyces boomerangus]|uniref:Extracellular membrane protein CFEM domain-containing protein n=1 Tax=Furculomyces boomerangus TaxID=61424 RepID=A0A2T9Y509_9FUNG|nr:hypothetical protein BB559_006086 [Furculomyces boomerangus]PVU91051.1 hypothetical protein BB559_004319 [Furculomyces boomerangus]
MNIVKIQVVLSLLVILGFVYCDCDLEEQFQECLSHTNAKKATMCLGLTDYECICTWSKENLKCYDKCINDITKEVSRSLAERQTDTDCIAANKFKIMNSDKTTSTSSSSTRDSIETDNPDTYSSTGTSLHTKSEGSSDSGKNKKPKTLETGKPNIASKEKSNEIIAAFVLAFLTYLYIF